MLDQNLAKGKVRAKLKRQKREEEEATREREIAAETEGTLQVTEFISVRKGVMSSA